MKLLYPARQPAEAHLIRGYLESCGIHTMVRGEFLSGGLGELPLDVCGVWINDDARYEEACRFLRDFLQGRPALMPSQPFSWVCPKCSETLEAQFTACWRCDGEHLA